MNRSIEHQDRSGLADLPLIVVDRTGNEVPLPDGHGRSYSDIYAFVEQLGPGHEALIRCMEHPDTPAVDCLICVPEEEAE